MQPLEMQAVWPTDVHLSYQGFQSYCCSGHFRPNLLASLGVCHGGIATSEAFDHLHPQLLTTPLVSRSELNNILLHRPFQGLSVKDMYKRVHRPYKSALHRAYNAPIGPEAFSKRRLPNGAYPFQ